MAIVMIAMKDAVSGTMHKPHTHILTTAAQGTGWHAKPEIRSRTPQGCGY